MVDPSYLIVRIWEHQGHFGTFHVRFVGCIGIPIPKIVFDQPITDFFDGVAICQRLIQILLIKDVGVYTRRGIDSGAVTFIDLATIRIFDFSVCGIVCLRGLVTGIFRAGTFLG